MKLNYYAMLCVMKKQHFYAVFVNLELWSWPLNSSWTWSTIHISIRNI